jgi:hypothetical protein
MITKILGLVFAIGAIMYLVQLHSAWERKYIKKQDKLI